MSENTEAGGGVPGAERGGSAARRVRQHVRAQQQQARPQGQEARPHRGEVLQLWVSREYESDIQAMFDHVRNGMDSR